MLLEQLTIKLFGPKFLIKGSFTYFFFLVGAQ